MWQRGSRRSVVLLVGVIAGCGKVEAESPGIPDAAVEPPMVDAAPPDAPMPAPGETCTPSTKGSTPVDENGSGTIDEGCAWNFGSPHWMAPFTGVPWETGALATDGNVVSPSWISADGNRLYIVHQASYNGVGELMVVSRTGRDAAFGDPVTLVGASFPDFSVTSIALSKNELEAFVEAKPINAQDTELDLYRMTRTAIGQPFSKMEKLAQSTTGVADERPHLRADGKELLWSTGRRLKRALRDSPTAAFGDPEPLVGVSDRPSNSPYLSGDGRTLFYYAEVGGPRYRILRAQRDSLASATFAPSADTEGVDPSGLVDVYYPVVSESTRELFYGSTHPWNPGRFWLWRAEICRDGPCVPKQVDCDGGVRSPDNMHCYKRLVAQQNEADAEAACVRGGGHLTDIQSPAEQKLIWDTYGNEHLWIGGFDDRPAIPGRPKVDECNSGLQNPIRCVWGWESGARWSYSAWVTVPGSVIEPQEGGQEDCVIMYNDPRYNGGWADISCAFAAARGVCENVLYPTW